MLVRGRAVGAAANAICLARSMEDGLMGNSIIVVVVAVMTAIAVAVLYLNYGPGLTVPPPATTAEDMQPATQKY
jgi:hypothetical protein